MPLPSLIATLFEPPSPDGAELTALPDSVDWLEVRADRVGDIDPEWLRDHFKGRLLYTFRTEDGLALNRPERLKTAARFYDRIELEIETDASEELLQLIPVEKRLLAWYGKVDDLSQLNDRFTQLSSVPAGAYKIVTTAESIAEEFLPLSLLKSLNRTDTDRILKWSTGLLESTARVAPWGARDLRTRRGRICCRYGTGDRQVDS